MSAKGIKYKQLKTGKGCEEKSRRRDTSQRIPAGGKGYGRLLYICSGTFEPTSYSDRISGRCGQAATGVPVIVRCSEKLYWETKKISEELQKSNHEQTALIRPICGRRHNCT